jgi:hypothetical protein
MNLAKSTTFTSTRSREPIPLKRRTMDIQGTQSTKSSTTKKWLIGCGIGCGVVIVGLLILGTAGYYFIKDMVKDFQASETLMDTLIERYGTTREFSPDPDGAIRPARIEIFLAVRSSMAPAMEEMERAINILSEMEQTDRDKEEPSPNVFTKIKTGLGFAAQIAEFYRSRNQALLDNDMGMGEYYYIYVMSYFSLLGRSPSDGPPFRVEDQAAGGRIIYTERQRETQGDRMDMMLRRVHRQIFPMLQNQYAKLTEGDVSRTQEKWRKALAAEIEAMESDRYRLPWKDGLPDILKTSLEPYRSRLESSYSAMLNIFEVTRNQRFRRD